MKANTKSAILLIALSLPTTLVAQTGLTVKPSGVRVISETVGEGFKGLTPFNTQDKGAALALLIKSGGPSIIKIDTGASKLVAFADDKGASLLTEGKRFNQDGIGHFARISEDGKAALVEITGRGLPTAGATKLNAEGTLVVQTASKKSVVKSASFELKKGSQVTVGDIVITVNKVGKPSFGDDKLEVEIQTGNKALETVAEVKFLTAAGKVIESRGSGSSSMGFGKKFTYGRSFNLKQAVSGQVVLQFEIWTDIAEKKVPFSVSAGIGG